MRALADQIKAVSRPHPTRVAIDGIDAAGKTTLADALVRPLQAHHRPVIRASIDSFHNPRAVRYQRGELSPEGYYFDSFDYAAVIHSLLQPLGPGGTLRYKTAAFDYLTDTAIDTPEQTASADAILLVDGIFLLRPELLPYWDFKIFLDIDFSTSINRALERHRQQFGAIEGLAEKYDKRYIPGQKLYLQSCQPQLQADVILDNNDEFSGWFNLAD